MLVTRAIEDGSEILVVSRVIRTRENPDEVRWADLVSNLFRLLDSKGKPLVGAKRANSKVSAPREKEFLKPAIGDL